MQWKRVAIRVFLFACFGLLIELFFTAGNQLLLRGNWNMHGNSSPWMTIVYGLLGVLVEPLSGQFKAWRIPFLFRAFIYMALIFLVEYLFGVLFKAMGLRIWDYSGHAYNLHGHITLTYTPFWFWLGLWIEYLHKKIDACSVTMARGFTAEKLLEFE